MQKNYKKTINAIILITILSVIIMSLIDGVIKPGYVYKSLAKILMFLIVPIGYTYYNDSVSLKDQLKLGTKKEFFISFSLGLGVYTFILAAYFVLRSFLDLGSIIETLNKDVGVAKENFLFVALYISFINSFIEEFFFRGLLFLNLKNLGKRSFAYVFSALAFAIYHVAIMGTWFSLPLFMLALIGLFIGGLIFNYLNSKTKNIYNSYIVHMMANFAINTVGMIMFGLLNFNL